MRRRLAMLASAALLAAGFVGLGPADPAHATNVCAGTGIANIANPGLLAPLFPIASSLPGSINILLLQDSLENNLPFNFGGAICTVGGTLTATGTVSGYCGQSGGQGTDGDGHLFGWVSAGTILLITHQITGVVGAVSNPAIQNNSCFVGHPQRQGATNFIITGGVVRTTCATEVTLQLVNTLTTTGGETLPFLTILSINFHLGNPAIHFNGHIHVCVGLKL